MAYLKATPAVASTFGARVFVGEPVSDQQAGTFACVNVVTQTRGEVDCAARVEIRICAHDEKTSKQALIDAQDEISRALSTGGPVRMGTFDAYRVDEGTDLFSARDDKNRNILVRDYIVRFIWST